MECFYCGDPIPNRYHHSYDHIISLHDGGKDDMENLVDCCRSCNNFKAALSIKEWLPLVTRKNKNFHENHPAKTRFDILQKRLEYILSDDDRPSPWNDNIIIDTP